MSALRRVWQAIDREVEIYNVLFLLGFVVIIGSDAHHPLAWPVVRTVAWIVGAFGFYGLGRRDGEAICDEVPGGGPE